MSSMDMMMMIIPNSLARWKEEVQGQWEEEAGDQRKGGQRGTLTSDADASASLSRSGVLDTRSKRKYGRWYGVLLHRKGGRG